jgi:hypothetical protein
MRPSTPTLAMLFVAVLIIGVAIAALHKPARGHDIYRGWSPPGNPKTSCCNDADCRPTRAYLGDDGLWRAWNGQTWLVVPPDRVLPTDLAGDGRSHLCEQGSFIYCFSPGQPRG